MCLWRFYLVCIAKKPSGKGSVPPEEKVEVSQLWAGQNLDGKGLFSVRRRVKSQCVVGLGAKSTLCWILSWWFDTKPLWGAQTVHQEQPFRSSWEHHWKLHQLLSDNAVGIFENGFVLAMSQPNPPFVWINLKTVYVMIQSEEQIIPWVGSWRFWIVGPEEKDFNEWVVSWVCLKLHP